LNELRFLALQALRAATVDARLRLAEALDDRTLACAPEAIIADPGDVPGRPLRPVLVVPGAVPARPAATHEGRVALLHALAHIEFNAIGLALDHAWRFPALPEAYYRDWVRVAVEEVHHFTLLRGRLNEAGYDYGDLPAHDGLWEMARKTQDDVLTRMALVPRTLEARGLDASPAVRAKFVAAGDDPSAQVIDVILRDEIRHVAAGNRWFRHLCAQRGVNAAEFHRQAARRVNAPRLRGPFNVTARREAGFTAQEIDELGAPVEGIAH
jgi:uncharacterized ferritin-like protein (DUF455 family)